MWVAGSLPDNICLTSWQCRQHLAKDSVIVDNSASLAAALTALMPLKHVVMETAVPEHIVHVADCRTRDGETGTAGVMRKKKGGRSLGSKQGVTAQQQENEDSACVSSVSFGDNTSPLDTALSRVRQLCARDVDTAAASEPLSDYVMLDPCSITVSLFPPVASDTHSLVTGAGWYSLCYRHCFREFYCALG